MIALVEYGAGNVASVERALWRLGATTVRCPDGESLSGARAVVLPGVGHFRQLAAALDARGLREPLLTAARAGTPLLGICLGMQALYDASDEAPAARGLGLLPGRVRALPTSVKLPHTGWNTVRARGSSRLLRHAAPDAWYYFAHAYAAPAPAPHEAVTAVCDYGETFAAVVEAGTVMGVQFHPEKSARAGERVLRAFLEAI